MQRREQARSLCRQSYDKDRCTVSRDGKCSLNCVAIEMIDYFIAEQLKLIEKIGQEIAFKASVDPDVWKEIKVVLENNIKELE